ncbi:MAG: MFS transporter [Candidatus Abyssobacteria bacterium SURF_5]|uniref:MFS transporter n=1 Tax=Abyssobacteria bacterium (strain SURF_5) TaxID=2093360 RepID=A0A3A4NK76_ABYX5|nr:MAG: MFS transporter [Candidatus Abyssubacteria bacterium SURF_5]
MTSEASTKAQSITPGRMAHITLAILFVMNLLNYIDRSVLNGMLPLIKDEWALSDRALGMLVSAFIFTYMIFSPLFGWLGDRYARKWIAGAGVAGWSITTAASALAQNFAQLFGFRLLLGVGEASYSTTAPTIITDLYPRESRSKMLAFFYVAIPVGFALGYILGGALGVRFGWRPAFLIVGLPGLLMALAITFIREPVRGQSEAVSEEELAQYLKTKLPLKAYFDLAHIPSYVFDTIGMTLMTFVTGGLAAWMPTYFYRVRGLSLQNADLYFGIATLAAGIIGTFFGGWLADRLQKRWESAYFLVSGAGLLLSVPCAIIALTARTPLVYWQAVFWAEFFLFVNTGPSNAIIINVTMPKMRVTAFALNIFFIHALGDVISPVLVGWVSDLTNLHFALLAIMPIVMALSAAAYLMGARHLVRDSERVLERIRTSS